MKRKIIRIDEEKCNGCGLCIPNCHEGALKITDGKARIVKDLFCDGLGACLGHCPTGALTIEERDTEAFDERAVQQHLARQQQPKPPAGDHHHHNGGGCPGGRARQMAPRVEIAAQAPVEGQAPSSLAQWPVQLKLVSPGAPYLKNAELLICADCVPFAVGDFHQRYLQGRAIVIGCPKLDDVEFYQEKLEQMFAQARPRKVIVLRMEVPCCGGIAQAAQEAHQKAIPQTPFEVHVIGIEGNIECLVVVA